MTVTITKTKLAIGILAMALIGTTAALAVDDNPFTDVPDSEGTEARFYSEPVEWLWDNGLTTGTSATTFSPDDNVTRGQYAAFNFRYDQNIVQPALDDKADASDLAAATLNLFASDTNFSSTTALGDLGLSASVTIPEGHTGVIEVRYTAESACYGAAAVEAWCKVELLVDGSVLDPDDDAFDSTDFGEESNRSWESHAISRVTDELGAGTYEVTVESSVVSGGADPTFRLDDMVLAVEAHLTS